MTDANGPQITAQLVDGPMAKRSTQVRPVEGRPPKTVDLDDEKTGARHRYCLADWEQSGDTARYSYLYEV